MLSFKRNKIWQRPKRFYHTICFTLCALLIPFLLFPQTKTEAETILDAAEGLFKSMKVKDYRGIWVGLSERSKKTIINDVYKELSRKEKNKYTEDDIKKDFERCDNLCRSYWNVFLMNFNPDYVLEESTWRMGSIKSNEAEVILQYRTSQRPATLKMYREDNRWKVGLTESFWSRK